MKGFLKYSDFFKMFNSNIESNQVIPEIKGLFQYIS